MTIVSSGLSFHVFKIIILIKISNLRLHIINLGGTKNE